MSILESVYEYIYLLSRCKDINNHTSRPTLNSVVLLFWLLFLVRLREIYTRGSCLSFCMLCSSWMIKLIFLWSPARQYKCGDNRITGHYSNERSRLHASKQQDR